MLDGLLGRSGFYSKCKSLVKQTRARIEVVKRKRNATQKFLRKDIADLLINRLDSNAFARTEGLISELILSSCYDFIDHVCELVLKHLPVLQKLRECPEDCRESVASLMFAAARFSDLPELRDLRDIFQERYGSNLEYYVNQKLVENLTPKPPSLEKKVQLLQDIALEFSISWDSRGFQERMANSVAGQKQWHSPVSLHAAKSQVSAPPVEETVKRTLKDEVFAKRSDVSYQNKTREADGRHQAMQDSPLGRRDDLKHHVPKWSELRKDEIKPPPQREATIQKLEDNDTNVQRRAQKAGMRDPEKTTFKEAVQVGYSSHGRNMSSVDSLNKQDRRRQDNISERSSPSILSQQKLDPQPVNNGVSFPSPGKSELAEGIHVKFMRKRQENATDGLKSNFRGGIPPPYSKPGKNKLKFGIDSHAEENDTLTFKPASNTNRAEMLRTKTDSADHQDGASASEDGDGPGRYTAIYYKDAGNVESTPRRRSHRRRHSRSSSTQDDEVNGEERVVRRVSTSRRKHESRKGLQILVDDGDDHIKKDEEEKIIDKLLLHYSKKPSSDDPGQSRRKTKRETNDVGKSPYHKAVETTKVDEESTPTTSRSFSLPTKQEIEGKPEKVYTRAASFQLDTPAKHVHPKLPDYDDLAARFAALRATKG